MSYLEFWMGDISPHNFRMGDISPHNFIWMGDFINFIWMGDISPHNFRVGLGQAFHHPP